MKISPVQGTPTIPTPSTSGVSPDKLERLKAIAAGQKPEEIEEVAKEKLPDPSMQHIKMETNKTVNRYGDPVVAPEAPIESAKETTPESVISDTDVQAKSEPEAIKPISPQLAELARQRRAIQVKEMELAKREESLKDHSTLIERLKKQPLSVLQEHGVTYDQLTNDILASQGGNQEVAALKAELAELRKGIDDKFAEKDSSQEQAVFSHIKRNVDSLSFSSEEYKFIRESKSQDDVVEFIRTAWKEKDEIVDEEEAMKIIEAQLREDAKRYAKLISELEAPPQSQAQTAPAPGGIKTITNKDSARPLMSRRQRAIAAALGQK